MQFRVIILAFNSKLQVAFCLKNAFSLVYKVDSWNKQLIVDVQFDLGSSLLNLNFIYNLRRLQVPY